MSNDEQTTPSPYDRALRYYREHRDLLAEVFNTMAHAVREDLGTSMLRDPTSSAVFDTLPEPLRSELVRAVEGDTLSAMHGEGPLPAFSNALEALAAELFVPPLPSMVELRAWAEQRRAVQLPTAPTSEDHLLCYYAERTHELDPLMQRLAEILKQLPEWTVTEALLAMVDLTPDEAWRLVRTLFVMAVDTFGDPDGTGQGDVLDALRLVRDRLANDEKNTTTKTPTVAWN